MRGGVRLRHLGLLVFGPMLVETLVMMLFFSMVLAAVAMGKTPRQQMWIGVVGAVAYSSSAWCAGRWVGRRAAAWLMLLAIPATAAVGLFALSRESFALYLFGVAAMGFCVGHYYTPFQINMGHVRPFRTLAWSIACYNIAWGTGAAAGPLLSGWLKQQPLTMLALAVGALVVLHTALNLLAWTAPQSSDDHDPAAAINASDTQRLTAWICFLTVGVVFRGLYATLWPDLGRAHGWSEVQTAAGAMCMSLPIPLSAPIWAKCRHLFRTPAPIFVTLAAGAIAFAAIPFLTDWRLAAVCAAVVGLAEGCAVFGALYYANADADVKRRGKHVGMQEVLAGLGFLLGPLILGTLAWDSATARHTYLAGSVLLVGALIASMWLWRHRHPMAR